MNFISTRGGSKVTSSTAILNGLANDGGLYVPEVFPSVTQDELTDMVGMDYVDRATIILSKYLTDFTELELIEYCQKAYARFDGEPAPVVKIDDDAFIMELWHGPTLAFKDIALTLLPHLMVGSREKQNIKTKTLILVATSGDTGKAALEGFGGVEGTEIVVFYPSDGVSDMQKMQMQTTPYPNVKVIGINGNFDDCQTAVKTIFKDEKVKEEIKSKGFEFSSANSINWGRLVPQIVYYFSAYLDMVGADEIKMGEKINFVVPSGNFGNILSGYYAMKMGLPIGNLIIASNCNNVLTEFFGTGKYDINREFYKTISPSMDILISSNLERLLFEMGGRDPEFVKNIMRDLENNGFYKVDVETIRDKFVEFSAFSSDEDETFETIDNFFDMYDYLPDTHTAVGISAYYKFLTQNEDAAKTVIVSTANPYKFPQDVLMAVANKNESDAFKAVTKLENYTGYETPESIKTLKTLPIIHNMVVDKKDIKATLLEIIK